MDTPLQTLVLQGAKCAILVMLGALAIRLVVRQASAASARWVRLACVVVLLQGWMLVPKTVTLAWLEPQAATQPGDAASGGLRPYVPETRKHLPTAGSWTLWQLAAGVWWSGIVVTAAAAWLGHRRAAHGLARARVAAPALQREWQQLTGDSEGQVQLLTGATRSPVLCRLRRQWSLVVPEDFATALDASERRAVFRHESAHFQRKDCTKSLLVALLVLPQWFNPAAWRPARWFREAAEWSCDDFAAANADERLCLANILHRLSAQSRAPLPCGMMGVAEAPVVARVRRLLTPPDSCSRAMASNLGAFLVVCMVASAFQIRLVHAESDPSRASESGVTTGVLRSYCDGILKLVDAEGREWDFRGEHACLKTYHPGETYTVRWTQGVQSSLLQRISGEGWCVGTVVRITDKGMDIQPRDGGPVQQIRAHWDHPSPAHPHGAPNAADVRLIQSTSVGDLVRVRWKAEEWKRLVELDRQLPL